MIHSASKLPKVSFNDPDEFLHELQHDQDQIDRKILRLTVRRRYGEPFVTVSVIGTTMIAGYIVTLDCRVGDAFAGDEKQNGLVDKTQTLLDKLTNAAQHLGLEVRAGVLE